MFSFDDLALNRRLLQDFCSYHVSSLLLFRSGISFRVHTEEHGLSEDAIQHLTTTATCLESLSECPDKFRSGSAIDISTLAKDFASKAIDLPSRQWMSEGSAKIYCRCRALPFVVRYLSAYNLRILDHLRNIFYQVSGDNRFAIGEADRQTDSSNWYPPNAFHTYWTLELLENLQRFRKEPSLERLFKQLKLERRQSEMRLWAKATLGYQIALHAGNSSVLDSDQLAWSLVILMKFGENLQSNLAEQDLIREALKCLFATQTEVGTWRRYQPLFHYQKAGNAYCYIFETFTVLLKACLAPKREAEFLRSALRPFFPKLMLLWQYAKSTQISLSRDNRAIGWCSGHRMNQPNPESWVTASVFSYAQALRRLVGIWAREEALTHLNPVRVPLEPTQEAEKLLSERGNTWTPSGMNVAERLFTMFVNPVRLTEPSNLLEPDNPPITDQQARSAILFGPPGTSKTNLARAVAGAIGWEYVELHASHFVADGLSNVQRTADGLFKKLMELDHTVVLFDEIDELVREREIEPDSLGRFLTNSMLPKLAQLWQQRKVIYFVATNHIRRFDSAIIRSQRFDALILVSPPSFEAKVARLEELLKHFVGVGTEIKIAFSKQEIEEALTSVTVNGKKPEEFCPLPEEHSSAKFLLLRWDQLDSLALSLAKNVSDGVLIVDIARLKSGLMQIKDARLNSARSYCEYKLDAEGGSKDGSKLNVWRANGLSDGNNYPSFIKQIEKDFWIVTEAEDPCQLAISGYDLQMQGPGIVNCLPVE